MWLLLLSLLSLNDQGYRVVKEPTRLEFFVGELANSSPKRCAALTIMVWGWEAAQYAPLDLKVLLDDFVSQNYDPWLGMLYPHGDMRAQIEQRRDHPFWQWYFSRRYTKAPLPPEG